MGIYVGEGIVKVIFDASTATPTVKSASRTVIDNGRMASNYFFTSYQENDSILWFGNRGCGAYRMNVEEHGEMIPCICFEQYCKQSDSCNDHFAIYKTQKVIG